MMYEAQDELDALQAKVNPYRSYSPRAGRGCPLRCPSGTAALRRAQSRKGTLRSPR